MKISTKGRYGTMVMLALALHYREGPIVAIDIARRRSIFERYLKHLLISLKGGRDGTLSAKSRAFSE